MNDIIFVGLDVHKASVAVAIAEGTRGGEMRQLGAIPNRADHIAKLVEKLGKGGESCTSATRLALAVSGDAYRRASRYRIQALNEISSQVFFGLQPHRQAQQVAGDRRSWPLDAGTMLD